MREQPCIAELRATGPVLLSANRTWLSFSSAIMVSVIETEKNIRKSLPFLDEVADEGLIAMSAVEVIKYVDQQNAT